MPQNEPSRLDAARLLDEIAYIISSKERPPVAYRLEPASIDNPLGKVIPIAANTFEDAQEMYPDGEWAILFASKNGNNRQGNNAAEENTDIPDITSSRLRGRIKDAVGKIAVVSMERRSIWATLKKKLDEANISVVPSRLAVLKEENIADLLDAYGKSSTLIDEKYVSLMPEGLVRYAYANAAMRTLKLPTDLEKTVELLKTYVEEKTAGALTIEIGDYSVPDEPEYKCFDNASLIPSTPQDGIDILYKTSIANEMAKMWDVYARTFGIYPHPPKMHEDLRQFLYDQAEKDGIAELIREKALQAEKACFKIVQDATDNQPPSSTPVLDTSEILSAIAGDPSDEIIFGEHTPINLAPIEIELSDPALAPSRNFAAKDEDDLAEYKKLMKEVEVELFQASADDRYGLMLISAVRSVNSGFNASESLPCQSPGELEFDSAACITVDLEEARPVTSDVPFWIIATGNAFGYTSIFSFAANFKSLSKSALTKFEKALDTIGIDHVADMTGMFSDFGIEDLREKIEIETISDAKRNQLARYSQFSHSHSEARLISSEYLAPELREPLQGLAEVDQLLQSTRDLSFLKTYNGAYNILEAISYGNASFSESDQERVFSASDVYSKSNWGRRGAANIILDLIPDKTAFCKMDDSIVRAQQFVDVMNIWITILGSLDLKLADGFPLEVRASRIQELGRFLGIDSTVEAYFAGVSLDDLLCTFED